MPNLATSHIDWVDGMSLSTGLPLQIAIHEITGSQPGPTIGISASIHGDELAPVEAIRRLVANLNPQEMSGTLRIAPVVNPLAFQAHTRHTPQDMQNMNRLFPGDPEGWLTEQLAGKFVDRFMPGLDALLDLHAGGSMATVDYVYITNDQQLSATFGSSILYHGPGYVGTLSNVAEERGIPCVVTELGGGILADEVYIQRTVEGLENALRHLGVLPGEVVMTSGQIVIDTLQVIRPHHGGLLVPSVGIETLGETVPGGTLLGSVYNPQTFELLEEIRAPFPQTLMILLRGATTRVEAGDYAYIVAPLE